MAKFIIIMVRLGEFKASLIPYLSATMVGMAIILCEIIAVVNGDEKPYPKATISSTSDHYPEFIIFRIATECGATMVIMTWVMNYFLVKSLYPKIGWHLPSLSVVFGVAGALCLMGSTATLDTGKHRTDWHQKLATSFFILTILACLYNTYITVVVHRKTGKLGGCGLIVKYIMTLLLVVWLILALFYKSPNKYFGNVVEYTLAFEILGYIYVIGYDMRDWRIDYQLMGREGGQERV